MVKTVKILGTPYKVHTEVPAWKDKELEGRFGYCASLEHKIVVADIRTVEGWSEVSDSVKISQTKDTLRHEVIHAFFKESGLWGSSIEVRAWSLNEEMVDWLALQFPKMVKVFEQLDCLGV